MERARSIASYPLTQLSDSDADDQEAGLEPQIVLRAEAPENLGTVPVLRVLLHFLQQGQFLHAFALWKAIPEGDCWNFAFAWQHCVCFWRTARFTHVMPLSICISIYRELDSEVLMLHLVQH